MELVEKLRFFNEYEELETVKSRDLEKALMGAAVGALGAVVLLIVSFLEIFFIFTGENVLVCCFCPNGGIWASGTMVEAAAAAVAESGVASLLR